MALCRSHPQLFLIIGKFLVWQVRFSAGIKKDYASAFPLAHHYRVVLVWGFFPQVNDSCLVIIGFAQNKIEVVYFLCLYVHNKMIAFDKGEEVQTQGSGRRSPG